MKQNEKEGIKRAYKPGKRLRNARERRGWQLATIARDTGIRQVYLEALESNDKSAIPGEAYYRAYIKHYARYLGLKPEFWLEKVDIGGAAAPRVHQEHTPENLVLRDLRPHTLWITKWSILLVICYVIWLFWPSEDALHTQALRQKNVLELYSTQDTELMLLTSHSHGTGITLFSSDANAPLKQTITPGEVYFVPSDAVALKAENWDHTDLYINGIPLHSFHHLLNDHGVLRHDLDRLKSLANLKASY